MAKIMQPPDEKNEVQNNQLAERILQVIKGIRFGSIEVTIHEGRIVQIERKEKIRFDN